MTFVYGALSLTSARLVVDATDTSTHYLPINPTGTFIPDDDDFVIISVPEGIDSIDFVPADLEPGTTYTVDIWNGTMRRKPHVADTDSVEHFFDPAKKLASIWSRVCNARFFG